MRRYLVGFDVLVDLAEMKIPCRGSACACYARFGVDDDAAGIDESGPDCRQPQDSTSYSSPVSDEQALRIAAVGTLDRPGKKPGRRMRSIPLRV